MTIEIDGTASTSALPYTEERLQGSAPRCVASASARSPRNRNAFFRSAKLCPDGSSVLVASEDRSLSLFTVPTVNEVDSTTKLDPSWRYPTSDALLSYEWFPGANIENPAMYSFVVAVKDHPIHLLDGSDHRLRANYPIIDHRERFIAPHSMSFSPDGSQLYCGFENAIEIFDVNSAGATGERLKTTPNRSSRDGQKGIISSLSFARNRPGLFAAGSFDGTIGMYDASAGENTLLSLLVSGEPAGITQVAFNPTSDLMYSASRLSSCVEVWDVRYAADPLGRFPRAGKTNQRMDFDVDPTGSWIAIGDQQGLVSIYSAAYDTSDPVPVTSFQAGQDSIGSALFHPSFHPSQPMLLTCSGTRTFDAEEEDSSDEEEAEACLAKEDSLKIWSL